MQAIYNCGCTVSRSDVGIPASWPMPYYCPAHGAPRSTVAWADARQSPGTGNAG